MVHIGQCHEDRSAPQPTQMYPDAISSTVSSWCARIHCTITAIHPCDPTTQHEIPATAWTTSRVDGESLSCSASRKETGSSGKTPYMYSTDRALYSTRQRQAKSVSSKTIRDGRGPANSTQMQCQRLSSLHLDRTLCQPSISSLPPLCSNPSPRSTHS